MKNKVKHIGIRLNENDHKLLNSVCNARGEEKSSFIRRAIRKELASLSFYPDDVVADENERFFVSEIIREKILELYRVEIPYSTEVMIMEFKERENAKNFISAEIAVERDSQKKIIIGKDGNSIKELGKIAREAVEEFLQSEVFLELRVKVRSRWRSEENWLRKFGYVNE